MTYLEGVKAIGVLTAPSSCKKEIELTGRFVSSRQTARLGNQVRCGKRGCRSWDIPQSARSGQTGVKFGQAETRPVVPSS